MFLSLFSRRCRRSRRSKREQDAVPDNGIALERREAPGPTSLGQRARKRQPLVTGDLPWRAADPGFGFANRRRSAGGASRRSIACFREGRKRGNAGRPGRPRSKARDRELVSQDAERCENGPRKSAPCTYAQRGACAFPPAERGRVGADASLAHRLGVWVRMPAC